MTLGKKPLENIVGKGENAGNPQCFLWVFMIFCHFHQSLNCHYQTLSVWESLKFVVWERVNAG